MDFSTEAGVFLVYACGILLVCFFGKMLMMPLKLIGKLIVNSFLGGFVLFCINAVLEIWGISIPINLVTAAVTGVLGVPGVVSMFLFFYIM